MDALRTAQGGVRGRAGASGGGDVLVALPERPLDIGGSVLLLQGNAVPKCDTTATGSGGTDFLLSRMYRNPCYSGRLRRFVKGVEQRKVMQYSRSSDMSLDHAFNSGVAKRAFKCRSSQHNRTAVHQ